MDWFRSWLDEVAPAGRPVLLVGFSGGAAFAGGLVLDDPARYAGAAILYGTLPFDAGRRRSTPGRLANLPVFVAQGDGDHVIPRELLDRTWDYLLSESGAPTVAHREPGGHQLTADAVHQLGDWIAHRLASSPDDGATPAGLRPDVTLAHARRRRAARAARAPPRGELDDPPAAGDPERPRGPAGAALRRGPRRCRRGRRTVPHLGARRTRRSPCSEGSADEQAFLVPQVGEFAHLHPAYDGSMHLVLPPDLAADVSHQGLGPAPHVGGHPPLPRVHDGLRTA